MAIIHIVLFEFKPSTTHDQVEDVCTRMLALSEKCLHPTTNKPYVTSYSGGRDTSPEGLQGGFSHGFVSQFESEEDRKYYLEKDPAHLEFVASLKDVIQNVRVLDFEPGKF
ncbi:Putative stress-response A/B barrel domain-containing protein HS1/DABB1 [Septoria linicola]|uniref:Stress-response A/B barrel domain-containing protein HS1/DABB1 n=1 Tax=Septoria linicola TaxID=215465 RepID=A0A9Q9AFV1_9PEZI|nr:putative stress-response A/B barrel domain-containing protein HS1/DABB1 [Septoria linicola]USW48679.1 Putative stress-response A/B barrel domain-containing protein HS1/DABB1 [Septoria linicola]